MKRQRRHRFLNLGFEVAQGAVSGIELASVEDGGAVDAVKWTEQRREIERPS
jgi:hypothetical protein